MGCFHSKRKQSDSKEPDNKTVEADNETVETSNKIIESGSETVDTGNETVYFDIASSGRQFGCDSKKSHMAIRDGTEWSCRTCYGEPIPGLSKGKNFEIIAYGFDVCNECYPKIKHKHPLEQGWKK
jgi:hypothetical protein